MRGNISKFAWRNVLRNRRRTALTLIAISIGVMSLIFGKGYTQGMINSMMEPIIKMQSGHIRLVHSEYVRLERIMPKEYQVAPLNQIQNTFKAIPEITSISRSIKFHTLVNHEEKNENCTAIGIYPQEARKNMDLKRFLIKGSYFSEDKGSLIIGHKLAKKLGVTIGDELLLVTTDINYSTYALPFKIAGIFEIGFSFLDKKGVFIHFEKAAEMLDYQDAAQEVLIYLANPDKARPVAKMINSGIEKILPGHSIKVIPWQENDFIKNTIPLIETVWGGMLYLMMFIAALVILNTMLMALMERYHEIGVMKAFGFKNREVIYIILAEAFYIGAIGSFIGGTLGTVLTAITEKTGIDIGEMLDQGIIDNLEVPISFFGTALYPELSFNVVVGSVIFGILTALVAAVYPALKSSKMTAVEAFRSELKV